MQINSFRNIFIALSVFSLVGCASFYDKQVDQPSAYVVPQKVDAVFAIDGRFSIVNSSKNYYGNFTWDHDQTADKLSLNSPLGNSVAVISVESSMATLQTKDGVYSGRDLDALLEQNIGFTLPINYLHYWVQGIPLPNYPVDKNLTSGFEQLGWNVEYLQWQDINHPTIIQVSNNELRIKLLVSNWN